MYTVDNGADITADMEKAASAVFRKIKELYPDMMGGEPKYIYESPDGGKTVYQRKLGDYDNKNQLNKTVYQ